MTYKKELWTPLPWAEWRDTAMTIHLFTQIIGKVRLALMPMQVEWAQVPLTLTSTGIASLGMYSPSGSVDINFDFINHKLNIFSSDGKVISFSLKNKSVAGFYDEVMISLKELEIKIKINPMSVEMITPVKMDTDEENHTYDEDAARRWWHLLVLIGNIFNEFRSRFSGKVTPVNFFWGSFDLAVTFFSGKVVEPNPEYDLIYRCAMDAEQTTIGFWPGSDESPEPVFFAYTFPKPKGLENEIVKPAHAKWSVEKGEFILPYKSILEHDNPEIPLIEFCESAYRAGVKLAGWNTESLEYKPPIEKPKRKN